MRRVETRFFIVEFFNAELHTRRVNLGRNSKGSGEQRISSNQWIASPTNERMDFQIKTLAIRSGLVHADADDVSVASRINSRDRNANNKAHIQMKYSYRGQYIAVRPVTKVDGEKINLQLLEKKKSARPRRIFRNDGKQWFTRSISQQKYRVYLRDSS